MPGAGRRPAAAAPQEADGARRSARLGRARSPTPSRSPNQLAPPLGLPMPPPPSPPRRRAIDCAAAAPPPPAAIPAPAPPPPATVSRQPRRARRPISTCCSTPSARRCRTCRRRASRGARCCPRAAAVELDRAARSTPRAPRRRGRFITLGMLDDPAAQAQYPAVFDLEEGGGLLIAGGGGSGKTTALRTVARAAVDGATPDEVALFVIDCRVTIAAVRCATFRTAPPSRPATTSSRSRGWSSLLTAELDRRRAAAVAPRRPGRDAVGVPRQGPLVAADRRARRRLPEPQRDPRLGAADGDRTARLVRRVPSHRHRRPPARHPRRPRRRPPPGGAGADDVVDRPAARVAPDRRAGLRRLRHPDVAQQRARAARRPRVCGTTSSCRSASSARPVGGGPGRGDRRLRQRAGEARAAGAGHGAPTRRGARAARRAAPRACATLGRTDVFGDGRRGRRQLQRALRRRPATLGTHDGAPPCRPLARRRRLRGVDGRTRRRHRRSRPHAAARSTTPSSCRGLRRALRVAAPERPYVLVVDDVDRYDDGGCRRRTTASSRPRAAG